MTRWIKVAVLLATANLASAQFGNRQEFSSEGSLIQAPREVERLLDQAKEAIKRESWSEATLSLGLLLGIEGQSVNRDLGEQDYFQSNSLHSSTRESVREAALSLAESMPEAGTKVFELRYGVAAEQALNEAIESGNYRMIESLAGKFAPTTAGRSAAWLTIESKIGDGEPMEAALRLERLLRQSKARDEFGWSGYVLAAACWKAAASPAQAELILKSSKTFFPNGEMKWAGKKLQADESPEELLAKINLGDVVSPQRKESRLRWIGGSEDRNGDFAVGVPLPLNNWDFWLHESKQHEMDAAKTIKQKLGDRSLSIIPSRLPLIIPPYAVVMSYDQRIYALNLRTGKLIWKPNTNHIPYDLGVDRNFMRDPTNSDLPIPDYLARRIWGERASGQLSSDGERIFSLSEMPSSEASESASLGIHARVQRQIDRSRFNVLQAFSIAQQGKLLWEVGGDSGVSSVELAGVLFLGTPIVHNGELLLIGELNGEVYLFGLAPESGKLRWKQQLVANLVSQISNDSIRRNMSCSPAASAGIVVAPTLSGQLVAMDPGARTLLWSHRYDQDSRAVAVQQFNAWGNTPSAEYQPLELRCSEASVVIAGTTVVHAPCDSNAVYGIDLLSGKRLWDLARTNALYLGGIWNGGVLLVRDMRIDCLDIRTGKSKWDEPVELASMGRVAGRGIRNGRSFFLPMTSQEIIEIDIESGKILDRMRVKEPLGNLAAAGDQILSLSPIALTAYSIRDRLRAEIDLDFAKGDNKTYRLLRESKLLLAEGKIDEALGKSEEAYRANREDPDARLLLQEIALMALPQDFDRYAKRFAEYEELIENGPERTLYLVSVIEGLLRRSMFRDGAAKILELADSSWNSLAFGSMMAETIEPEPGLQVRQDIWAAAKLAQFYEAASSDERVEMRKLIEPRIAKLLENKPNRDYGRQSNFLRWLPQAMTLRLKDAESYFVEREGLLAEHTLEEAMEVASASLDSMGKDADTLRTIMEQQADRLRLKIYRSADRWTAAVAPANRLRYDASAAAEFWKENDTSQQAISSLVSSNRRPIKQSDWNKFESGIKGWPQGKSTVENLPLKTSLQTQFGGQVCTVKQRVGTALKDWRVSIYENAIELVDPLGEVRLLVRLEAKFDPAWPATVHFVDSIAIVETQNELIAIDTIRAAETADIFIEQPIDPVMWRAPFGRQVSNLSNPGMRTAPIGAVREAKAWGEVRIKNQKGFRVGPVSRSGIFVASENSLVCLDPRTGSRRWARSGVGNAPMAALDGFRLAVMDPSSHSRSILDVRDGRLIEQKEWLDKSELWCSSGENVLSAARSLRDEGKISFRLWNAFTGATVLESDFGIDIRADVCDQERFVMWSASHGLTFWNLRLGEANHYDVTLPDKLAIRRIGLERFDNILLVFSEAPGFVQDEIVRMDETEPAKRLRGPMIALNWDDGRPLWSEPRMVYDFVFPPAQLRTTPILSLVRSMKFKAAGTYPATSASIALFDLRDGRLLFAENYLDERYGLGFQSMARLGVSELLVQYRGNEVKVRLSDEKLDADDEASRSGDIGKRTREQMESETPKDFVERLQSIDSLPNSGDPFGIDDSPNLQPRR
jgi:outer membrane protein assembly factor BamB